MGLLLISVRHLDHCGRKPCWTAEAKNNNLPDQRNEDTCTSTHVSYTGVKKGGGLGNNQSAQCLTGNMARQYTFFWGGGNASEMSMAILMMAFIAYLKQMTNNIYFSTDQPLDQINIPIPQVSIL